MKLSKMLVRALTGPTPPVSVVFQERDDGLFDCSINGVGATATTPKRALTGALEEWKRISSGHEGGPYKLKRLRKLVREGGGSVVSATPEAVTRTMRMLGIGDSTNYEDLYKRVHALVSSNRLEAYEVLVEENARLRTAQTKPHENQVALVDTLIALLHRAAAEMPDRRLRGTFEADLAALLKDHGIELSPPARRESR